MPFVIGTRKGRIAALATSLAALMLAPSAQAASAPSNPFDCAPDATLSQPFLALGDLAQYTPVVNAGFEDGAAGWLLSGGARVVDGNEPWNVGGAEDSKALDLPGGASVVSAPMCIDETYPHFRLFAKRTGGSKGGLHIDVLFLDGKGKVKSTEPFDYTSPLSAWLPTGNVNIGLFDRGATGAAPVSFRFTTAKDARYQIDDVYVDPMSRR